MLNIESIRKNYLGNLLYDWARLVRDSKNAFERFKVVNNRYKHFLGVVDAHQQYGWYPEEYFYYHYEQLSKDQRESFIGDNEYTSIAEAMNGDNGRVLSDKWQTYKEYTPFFQREAILTEGGGIFRIRQKT